MFKKKKVELFLSSQIKTITIKKCNGEVQKYSPSINCDIRQHTHDGMLYVGEYYNTRYLMWLVMIPIADISDVKIEYDLVEVSSNEIQEI